MFLNASFGAFRTPSRIRSAATRRRRCARCVSPASPSCCSACCRTPPGTRRPCASLTSSPRTSTASTRWPKRRHRIRTLSACCFIYLFISCFLFSLTNSGFLQRGAEEIPAEAEGVVARSAGPRTRPAGLRAAAMNTHIHTHTHIGVWTTVVFVHLFLLNKSLFSYSGCV